jgi:hypothetical protein
MCVDYHGLNNSPSRNSTFCPWFQGCWISSIMPKCTLKLIYVEHLVHIWEGNEWKTTFRTHYDHFEYVVMSFSFTNTFVVFQHLMNNVFCEYLDDFMVCYIDDIFIFSKNMENHEHHIHLVLEKFQHVKLLFANLEKCEFH